MAEVAETIGKPLPQCAFLKRHIANYKVPKGFDIAPALPLLPNRKTDKLALKQRLKQRFPQAREQRQP